MIRSIAAAFILFLCTPAFGEELKSFTFETIEGKKIEYRPSNGTPLVINVGSHW